jgi:pseudouridine synthase
VCVNGQPVTVLGSKVSDLDQVTVNGRLVHPTEKMLYIMLNKPAGYVTTSSDPQGRPGILDLLPRDMERVFSMGRLDMDTSGLLLLTNDGDLTQSLLHPSMGVWKTYLATVTGIPTAESIARLRRGLELDDGPTAAAKAKIVGANAGYAMIEIKLHEGRKRQVRRMLAAVGHPVSALERIAFGPLDLADLAVGKWRFLSEPEVMSLRSAVTPVSTVERERDPE